MAPSGLASFLLLGALGGVALLVFLFFLLRRGDSNESPGSSRVGRVGCVTLGIGGIALVAVILRQQATPYDGEAEVVLICEGAEFFLGDEYLATSIAALEPLIEGTTLGPEGLHERLALRLLPDHELLEVTNEVILGALHENRAFRLITQSVMLRAPSGALDPVIVLIHERPEGGAGQIVDRSALFLRTRGGAFRHAKIARAGTEYPEDNLFRRLIGFEKPPTCRISIELVPTPEAHLPDEGEPTYVVDSLVVPERP